MGIWVHTPRRKLEGVLLTAGAACHGTSSLSPYACHSSPCGSECVIPVLHDGGRWSFLQEEQNCSIVRFASKRSASWNGGREKSESQVWPTPATPALEKHQDHYKSKATLSINLKSSRVPWDSSVVRALATKPNDLNLIPGTWRWTERTDNRKVTSDLHIHIMASHMSPHVPAYTHILNK